MSEPWKNPVTLARIYDEEGTIPATADRLNCAPRTIRSWLNKHDIKSNGPGRRPVWETEDPATHVLETDEGYEIVETHDPVKDEDGEIVDTERRHIKIHVLVAIAEWGIEQVKGTEIHHANGMKLDNRPENLIPMDNKRHAAISITRRWDQPIVGDYEKGEHGP